jgi:hypothetical protein
MLLPAAGKAFYRSAVAWGNKESGRVLYAS